MGNLAFATGPFHILRTSLLMMNSQITDCRSAIDQMDRQLVALVEKRFQRARELARGKKQSGVPVIDRARELSILKRVAALSSQSPCPAHIFAWFRQVLQESRAVQLRTAEPEDRPKKRQPERRLS
jgi:chorismate mutase